MIFVQQYRYPFFLSFLLALALTCSCARSEKADPAASSSPATPQSITKSDEALQQAAVTALGEREGTVVVIDPQTGRIRALVNPRLAAEQQFPPGSAIKPFTLLTALRTGIVSRESKRLCAGKFARGEFEIICSHQKNNSAFSPAQALAYSCNDFFAHTGERLNESAFAGTLTSFGLGRRTGINLTESEGELPRDKFGVREALGDSEHLLVTPIQLLMAYSALVNGGHLLRPKIADAADFNAEKKSRISISPVHRTLLVEGMRGVVRYGTASQSGLSSLPAQVFGKTGTSTSSSGFRNNGWFVAFVGSVSQEAEISEPENIRLGVLVFLKRARGAEGAEVAKSILEKWIEIKEAPEAVKESATIPLHNDAAIPDSQSTLVRVHLVRSKVTRTLPLEEYVRGVIAAEGSTEDEVESLRALAVTARTYALGNRGRHEKEGYDFCNLTHCQRFTDRACNEGDASCEPQQRTFQRVEAAISEASGLTLCDSGGQPIETYFHAACGGMTADISTMWGNKKLSYLRPVRDDYCATRPNRNWTQLISGADLLKALQSDSQSDPGRILKNIIVTKRDVTGRVEIITLEGERRRTLRGWDFKTIVGRQLGWNLLKSSRFEIMRAGADFIFRGSGFGHGLGLCQEGAHVMAQRGMNFQQILSFYFPGTRIGITDHKKSGTSISQSIQSSGEMHEAQFQRAAFVPPLTEMFLASEHFRVRYPRNIRGEEISAVLRTLESAHRDMMKRISEVSSGLTNQKTDVLVYASTGDFCGATGQPPFAAAVTRGQRIHLQPLSVLQKRGVLGSTLRHEFAHVVIDALSHGKAPRWLAEGMAIHCAGEAKFYAGLRAAGKKSTPEDLEKKLAQPASAAEMKQVYAAAWREVQAQIQAEGEAEIWRRIAAK